MKTIVLSALGALPGAGPRAAERLMAEIAVRGWPVQAIDLTGARILHCRGCSGCTEKTPGRCVLKDDMQDILPLIVASECLILATPVFLGGHHPALKQAIDRFLPLAAPVWERRNGELHHRMRYPRRPALLGVGLLPAGQAEQADTFARLIGRHAVNMDLPGHATVLIPPEDVDGAGGLALRAALGRLEEGRA